MSIRIDIKNKSLGTEWGHFFQKSFSTRALRHDVREDKSIARFCRCFKKKKTVHNTIVPGDVAKDVVFLLSVSSGI